MNLFYKQKLFKLNCISLALCSLAFGQQSQQQVIPPVSAQGQVNTQPLNAPSPLTPQGPESKSATDSLRPNYELGPGDQILIHAPDAEELNDKPFRIEEDGTILLPLVGTVKASGMTQTQLEDDLKGRLKAFIRNPLISITVTQFRSSPVFFVGEWQRPGAFALQGRHTLVEMLMNGGGLLPTASRRIKVTRKDESGPIPLPGAVEDPDTKTSSVEINLAKLTENINPAEDIVLQPYDVITVERAEMVYTQGALAKNGGFDVGTKDSISVLQLISLAGGLTPDAEANKATILRAVLNTNRRAEIPLDLTRIMNAEGRDYPLLPNDILSVPHKRQYPAAISRMGIVAASVIPSILFTLLLR